MPPSGFNAHHTTKLSDFLNNCLGDLIDENRGIRTPHEAVMREIQNITVHLTASKCTETQRTVLELTRDFYRRVLRQVSPSDPNMNILIRMGITAAGEIAAEAEAIKVVENPALVTVAAEPFDAGCALDAEG